jgi:hypothetical protein
LFLLVDFCIFPKRRRYFHDKRNFLLSAETNVTKENTHVLLYNEMYTILFSVQHTKITIQEKRILLNIIYSQKGRKRKTKTMRWWWGMWAVKIFFFFKHKNRWRRKKFFFLFESIHHFLVYNNIFSFDVIAREVVLFLKKDLCDDKKTKRRLCVGWTNFWRGRLSFYMIFFLYIVCVMELPYFLLSKFF